VDEEEELARYGFTSSVVLQASMSYFAFASEGDMGRPDQMTESGSTGGIKSVRLSSGME
jgi:hypothetical protein